MSQRAPAQRILGDSPNAFITQGASSLVRLIGGFVLAAEVAKWAFVTVSGHRRAFQRGSPEEHQGTYILAAIRAAGHVLPAIFSHDFDSEPRRWANLERQYAPVHYLPDNASAATLRALILRVATRRG